MPEEQYWEAAEDSLGLPIALRHFPPFDEFHNSIDLIWCFFLDINNCVTIIPRICLNQFSGPFPFQQFD